MLLKGIYYETQRDRYRVRLHKHGVVVHRSYHKELDDAEEALIRALVEREDIKPPKPRKEAPLTATNLLRFFVPDVD